MYALLMLPLLNLAVGAVSADWSSPDERTEWVLRIEPTVLDALKSGKHKTVVSQISADDPSPKMLRIKFAEDEQPTNVKEVNHVSTPGIRVSKERGPDQVVDDLSVEWFQISIHPAIVDQLKTGKIEIVEPVPEGIHWIRFVIALPDSARKDVERAGTYESSRNSAFRGIPMQFGQELDTQRYRVPTVRVPPAPPVEEEAMTVAESGEVAAASSTEGDAIARKAKRKARRQRKRARSEVETEHAAAPASRSPNSSDGETISIDGSAVEVTITIRTKGSSPAQHANVSKGSQ